MPDIDPQANNEPPRDDTGDDLPAENPKLVGTVQQFKVEIRRPVPDAPAPDSENNPNSNAP